MKAWHLNEFGLEKITLEDVEAPTAGPGEVLVDLKAASINYRDFMIANGWYNPNLNLPLIPLSDGAGDVVAVGDGVTDLKVGDRVTPLFFPLWDDGLGTWDKRGVSGGCEVPGVAREFGVYAQSAVVKFPDSLSYTEAAALPCAALTAWSALTTNCNVQSDDTVLVQGTGGVSLFALQFAKALGAKVVATSSSNDKLAKVKDLGADFTINYTQEAEWGNKVAEITGGGVNAVVEIGGGDTLAHSIAACNVGGHISIIGNLSGISTELALLPLLGKNLHLHGQTVGHRADYEAMLKCIADNNIKPVISDTFGFDDLPKALVEIAKGAHFGKLAVSY